MPKVTISVPEKLLYPSDGITKAEVIAYYRAIAPHMLPFIKDRPLTTQRFPHGVSGSVKFFQKNIPAYFPSWIERLEVPNKSDNRTTSYVICNNISSLTYLVNEYCLVFHTWLSKKNHLEYPDRMVIDLDPGSTGFDEVKHIARELRDVLQQLELESFVMTTGSRGLHVVCPLDAKANFDEVRWFAQQLLSWFHESHRGSTTTEMHIKDRHGRIFLDYLRNAYGQTAVAPYSLRPYSSAPVATPLAWHELYDAGLSSQSYTIRNILSRIEQTPNPWASFYRHKGSIHRSGKLFDALSKNLSR